MKTQLPLVMLTIIAMLLIAVAQTPAVPVLAEVERLKVVNAWQAAIIAQVDAQNAQQRLAKARDNWNAVNTDVKAAHKWDSTTTFEINSETGEVLVHLPPTKTTNPPASGTKEQH